MVDGAKTPRQGIQSVETGMQILDVMAKAGRPLSLSEVGKMAGMPPSKTHRYLVSFGRSGMTQQDAGTSLYDLGPAMRRIGAEALRRTNEVQSASSHAIELRDRTGHSVNVFVWGDAGPTLVNWAYGAHAISITVRIGASLPLLSSSAGLIYLSTLPESMVKRLVDAEVAADSVARQRWERFAETIGTKAIVICAFLVGAISLLLMSLQPPVWIFYILVFVSGFGFIGSQILGNALIATRYAPALRGNGLSWALAIGRVGAIVGPSLGAWVLTSTLSDGWNFYAFAIPALVGATAAALVPRMAGRSN